MFNVGDRVVFNDTFGDNWLSGYVGKAGTVVDNGTIDPMLVNVVFDDPTPASAGWHPSRFKLTETKQKQTEAKMHDVTYRLIGDDDLVVVIDYGKPHEINSSNRNFDKILDILLNTEDYNETVIKNLEDLLSDITRVLVLLRTGNGDLVIQNNTIYYQNEPLHGALVSRILTMLDQDDQNVQPLIKFLERLQANPSFRVREQLYRFLDAGKNIITKDGKFLAYKKVKEDFTDIYTGSIRNKPGDAPSVDRRNVDDDPEKTCSKGLHVCSYKYLNQFGVNSGNKVVVCEVDPANVVSVPKDYNDTKMRTCGYRVIKEIPYETWMGEDVLGTNSVATEDDPWYDSGCADYGDDNGTDWVSSSDNC